jgi:hypothetical protein
VAPRVPTSSSKTSARTTTRLGNAVIPLTLYFAGFFVFFRWQIFSAFDLVFGDRGDARFVTFIHEHIYRWLHGGAEDRRSTLRANSSAGCRRIVQWRSMAMPLPCHGD